MEIFQLFGTIFLKDEEARKGLDEIDKKAEKTGSRFGDLTAKAGKLAIGLAALGGAAVVGAIGKGVSSADELQKALNGVQSATGYSTEAMAGMKDAMLDVYKNNFGEGFEDIGKAMTTIGQQTGASGQKLADLTKTALAMRDTFEFDVNESIRSANMLMTQFGLSGDQAYNLIAQGAQKGLDKNGDLLDTVNEYSVHFKQLGIGAEEMFNMLANGAASGTFSVDKLGDAVKEFGIRAKDGSDTTKQAFTSLGLDVNKVSADFAAGGEKGRAAFELVTKKLLEMKDPLAQNQSGVALFGTMWEDLGVKGIEALTNVNGQISNTNNALQNINNIKYDSFGEALAGIGRQFETGLIIPLGEKVLPKLNDLSGWVQTHMPEIQTEIENAMNVASDVFDGFATAIQFVIDNANILIPVLGGVTGAILAQMIINTITDLYKKWKLATEAQTASQVILNGIMNANPFGAVAIAIGALITAGVLLYQNWDTVSAFLSETWENIKNLAVNVFNGLKDFFTEWGPLILAIITGPTGMLVLAIVKNWDTIKEKTEEIFNGIKSFVTDITSGIASGFKSMVSSVISGLNTMISALNGISFEFPDWIPVLGSKSFSLNIPMLAEGGTITGAGKVLVGENGPEFLDLPEGAKVTPLDKVLPSENKIDNNFNIEKIEVRSDNDIKLIARELFNLQTSSMRGVGFAK